MNQFQGLGKNNIDKWFLGSQPWSASFGEGWCSDKNWEKWMQYNIYWKTVNLSTPKVPSYTHEEWTIPRGGGKSFNGVKNSPSAKNFLWDVTRKWFTETALRRFQNIFYKVRDWWMYVLLPHNEHFYFETGIYIVWMDFYLFEHKFSLFDKFSIWKLLFWLMQSLNNILTVC